MKKAVVCPQPANMRLAHGGRRDDPPPPPPPPSTATPGHASGNESVTPTTELVPGPDSSRSKDDNKGAVVPSTLKYHFETERPHLADETALERPSVAARSTETGRALVYTETKTALERPSVGAAETELRRSHVVADAETDLGRPHVVADADTELGRPHVVAADTELGRSHVADADTKLGRSDVDADAELGCFHAVAAGTDELGRTRVAYTAIKIIELTDDENHHSQAKPEKRASMYNIERHRSCVVTLSDIQHDGLQPRRLLQTIEISKSPEGGSQYSLHEETTIDTNASHRHAIADAALEALKRSIVYLRGQLNGAAMDWSQGAALNYDQVFMRKVIPRALAFLMKETACLQSMENMVDIFKVHHRYSTQKTESLLPEFGETAIGRVAPVDSGLWWITLLHAYAKWTGDSYLAENPNFQRAMHLILKLCISEGYDTSPALICANGCSLIDQRMGIYGYTVEFQARLFMAIANAAWEVIRRSIIYFRGQPIRTVAAANKSQAAALNYDIFTEGSSSLNTATICLDGSDKEVLASYRRGIGRIRWYCKKKGKSVDLSRIFGPGIDVFTTPEDGTFFLTLVYKGRSLTLCMKARDLYIMGWRTAHGTYEIRLESENRYMLGEDVTMVNCPKNYSLLSGDVSLTRIGPSPVREAFETLFKCRGEPSRYVKQAIARYAVHFSESARIQSVFNTVCSTYSDPNFPECELDNTRYKNNSLWIRRYAHYSRELMKQINELKAGRIPKPITNKGDDNISSPIDILREIRILLSDVKPAPNMTEVPLVKKHPKSHTEDGNFPASILDDLPEADELERRLKAELERISELKSKQAQQESSQSVNGRFGEFLNQFPVVKRRFTTLGTSSSTADRFFPENHPMPQRFLPLQKPYAPTVQRVYSPPHIEKLQAPSALKLQPPSQPRIHCLQPSLARATRFMGRILRFVR